MMEFDNDENTWRPSSPKEDNKKCQPIPKRSTTVAVIVLGLAVLSCLLGYCVLSEQLPYESKTLRLVIIVSFKTFRLLSINLLLSLSFVIFFQQVLSYSSSSVMALKHLKVRTKVTLSEIINGKMEQVLSLM